MTRLTLAACLMLAAGAVPLAAQTSFSVPGSLTLCSDLSVTIQHQTPMRGQMRTVVQVTNTGPGAWDGARGQQWLSVAGTAAQGATQNHRFAFVDLAPGQSRAFTFDRPMSEGPFSTWALIEFAPNAAHDCNPGNNAAVAVQS